MFHWIMWWSKNKSEIGKEKESSKQDLQLQNEEQYRVD
jgi:hypothetical protein